MTVIDGRVVKFIELFADDISVKGRKKFKDAKCWNENWGYQPITTLEFWFEDYEATPDQEDEDE